MVPIMLIFDTLFYITILN